MNQTFAPKSNCRPSKSQKRRNKNKLKAQKEKNSSESGNKKDNKTAAVVSSHSLQSINSPKTNLSENPSSPDQTENNLLVVEKPEATKTNLNLCIKCSDQEPVVNNKGFLSKAALNDYQSACQVSQEEVKNFFHAKGIYTYSSKPLSGNTEIPLYSSSGPSSCKSPLFISCAEQLIYNSPTTMSDKNNSSDLSRDDVKAQREAKKLAKLAAKQKSKGKAEDSTSQTSDAQTEPAKPAKTLVEKTVAAAVSENKTNPPTIEKKVKPPASNSNVVQTSDNKENLKTEAAETKTKAQLKAERRAKQEQQRSAKSNALVEKTKTAEQSTKPKTSEGKSAGEKTSKPEVLKTKEVNTSAVKKQSGDSTKVKSAPATTLVHKVKLFNHLYRDNLSITQPSDVHPAIFRLGVQYSTGVVRGSNARCVALFSAIKQMVSDYSTPSEKEYARGFEERLGTALSYLNKCRPHSVSMLNAVKHFKSHLTQLPNDITDTQARLRLKEVIGSYIHEQVEMAGNAICMFFHNKLANDDVILTYGCSSLVEKIILTAHQKGTKFRVIVVDGSPWFEGKEMLRRLVKHQVDCSYVLLSAVSYIMREVSKVIIGAHALLSNGAVMSRAGTAHVCLVARAFNVPVLAACETHKFCERVQTDALVFNELGDPDELISEKSPAKNWKSLAHLTPLSLTYDITPSHLVTAVITELAIVPCTSVPVVLRVKPTESQ